MNKLFNANIKFKVSICFILAFLVFLGVQHLSNRSIKDLKLSEQQMLSSSLLSKRLDNIESSIYSYENKITSFALTGNKDFLIGNDVNIREVSINLQYAYELPINKAQTELLVHLDSLVKEEIDFSQQALIAYDLSNRADVVSLINSGKGNRLLTEISNTTGRIQFLEESNLTRIIQNSSSFSNKVIYLDYAASFFGALVILLSIFILFRDIDKRVMVEIKLRASQKKAEQLALVKEQFMANMSHEIRTPMNAIMGFANLVSKSELNSKQTIQVRAIQTSCENLLGIINDILDFSKIEAGMVRIECIPFSPVELLDSLKVLFLQRVNEKHLQMQFSVEKNLPPVLLGDPARLTQILINLLSNAIKFTNEGSISVKVDCAKEEESDVYVRFMVKDTGIGIHKDKLDDIFERFTQANAETNRKYGGSGLGLSIAKKLIEIQNGNISVESAEGVGSCFSLTIPYKRAVDEELVYRSLPHEIQRELTKKIRILVAEDNILNQQLTEALLSDWGFEFDVVENGKLAIEKLEHQNYDLILMDIQMPEMNGYEASEIIRKKLKLPLPIIAMTAHVMPGEIDKCRSFGMTDYISKPINENELYNLITKYVQEINSKLKTENGLQETESKTQGVVDLTYLHKLSNGKINFVNQMIELFLAEIPGEIKDLETAIMLRNFQTIHALSHKIKSSISFAGLDNAIKNELQEIDDIALTKSNIDRIIFLFSKVKIICERAVVELNHMESHQL